MQKPAVQANYERRLDGLKRREERAVHQVLQRLHSVGHSQLALDIGGARGRRSSNDAPAFALSFPAASRRSSCRDRRSSNADRADALRTAMLARSPEPPGSGARTASSSASPPQPSSPSGKPQRRPSPRSGELPPAAEGTEETIELQPLPEPASGDSQKTSNSQKASPRGLDGGRKASNSSERPRSITIGTVKQQEIITAVKEGTPPNGDLVALAGLRSKHNTYMSIPLVWTMMNQHTVVPWASFGFIGLTVMVAIGWWFGSMFFRQSAKVQGF